MELREDVLLGGENRKATVEERIDLALTLYTRWEAELRHDGHVWLILDQLKKALEASRKTMSDLGIDLACARCDESSPEGSCCSIGLEDKFDAVLLLVNILLGADIPSSRARADSCYFLGPKGCALLARNMLCIDYLCPQLEKELGHEALVRMQTVAGKEIQACFLLCEALKKIIFKDGR